MSKHTPGPWEYEGKTFDARHRFYPVTANARTGCLAAVDRKSKDDSEGEANAKLIAADQELLEALIAVDTLFGHLAKDSTQLVWLDKARAAIKKATE